MQYSNCCYWPMSQLDVDKQRCPCCNEHCVALNLTQLDFGDTIEPLDEELDAIEGEQERNGELDEDINNQNNTSSRGER